MKRVVIVLGVIFLALGVIGLVHPVFNYHQQEEVAKIGPIKATVNEEKSLEIPRGRNRTRGIRTAHKAVVSWSHHSRLVSISSRPYGLTLTATPRNTPNALTSLQHRTKQEA